MAELVYISNFIKVLSHNWHIMTTVFVLQIQNDIVDILMAFTQPSLAKEESEEGISSSYRCWHSVANDNTAEEALVFHKCKKLSFCNNV